MVLVFKRQYCDGINCYLAVASMQVEVKAQPDRAGNNGQADKRPQFVTPDFIEGIFGA